MRFLHTADWHLGRLLHGMDLLDCQAHSLECLIDIAKRSQLDAIVVAGDIYDRAIPPERAVRVLDDVLARLREIAPVLMIAGNHDSGSRLDFGRRIMQEAGVYLVGTAWGGVERVDLPDAHGSVAFHLMPYATPAEVRSERTESEIRTHQEATVARFTQLDLSGTARHVLVGHLFVQGGQPTEESERDISVGGVSAVEASVFAPFAYTALGHLHRPHQVGSPRIQYSGSIGRYSFSEENHHKGVNLVEVDAAGELRVEFIELAQRYPMRTLRGSFAEIQQNAARDVARESTFIKVVLTDRILVPNAMTSLRQLYPMLLEFGVDSGDAEASSNYDESVTPLPSITPFEQFEQFLRFRNVAERTEAQQKLAQQCMEWAIAERESE